MQSLTAPGSGPTTLKAAQLAAVDSMLSLPPSDHGGGTDAGSPWKILVYDRHTRGIISPLLSVSALRERGVTLHLLLGSEREPIPGEERAGDEALRKWRDDGTCEDALRDRMPHARFYQPRQFKQQCHLFSFPTRCR